MELLFNYNNKGQEEITELLGFLSDDFEYDRMVTDLKLNTPELINFISEEVYTKILAFYKSDTVSEAENTKLKDVLYQAQLFVCIKSYHDFAGNNDLMHTTAGRKMNKAEDEQTPWDWQIASDNANLMKKAYKALDQLIIALDKSELEEWLSSDACKVSKSLFIYNTSIFNKIYPINHSEQLYYRLVPFMSDFEIVEISTRLGEELYTRLKKSITPSSNFTALNTSEKSLKIAIENAIVYLTLAKAYKVFPIEMFPDKINYRENTKMKAQARAEVMQHMELEAQKHLVKTEQIVKTITSEETPTDTLSETTLTPGLEPGQNHVDL